MLQSSRLIQTNYELRLSPVRPNVTTDVYSKSEEIRRVDISNAAPLEGVNLVDTMKGARVNIRAENGVVAADTSSKHDFLIVPNNGGGNRNSAGKRYYFY